MEDITKEGVKGLKGIRNPDLYNVFSEEEKERIEQMRQSAAQRNYNYSKGHIGYEGLNNPSLYTPQVTNFDFGSSKFDRGILVNPTQETIQNNRASNQTGIGKIANGLAKGAVLAGTTFLDGTAGLLIGAGTAISEGRWSGLWDNDFSKAMKNITDATEKYLPNYYSTEEQDTPWYENIFTANFFGDKLIKNFGFVVGAMYSGGVWSKALKGVGAAIETAAKISKSPGIVNSAIGTVFASVNEGRIEALNNSTDWYETQKYELDRKFNERMSQYDSIKGTPVYDTVLAKEQQAYEETLEKLNEDRLRMGNVDLLLNLPILMASNIIQFGKLYANGFKTARKTTHIVERTARDSKKVAKAAAKAAKAAGKTTEEIAAAAAEAGNVSRRFGTTLSKTKGVGRALLNPFSEGVEEISQGAAAAISGLGYEEDINDFYRAKINGTAEKKTIDWMKAAGQGIAQTLSEGSSWEEFFIGTLTGALGVPGFRGIRNSEGKLQSPIYPRGGIYGELKDYNQKLAREEQIAEYLTERANDPKFLNYYQGMIRHNKFQEDMNKAAELGDEFNFKNSEYRQLISDISMHDAAGRLEEYKSALIEGFDTSDENLEAVVRNTTTTMQDEEGKTVLVGPFSQYAKLNSEGEIEAVFADEKSKKAMADKLTENKDEILKAIDEYLKIKDEIDVNTHEILGDEQLEELTFIQGQINNWIGRRDDMFKKIEKLLKRGFNPHTPTSDAFKELMQTTDADDFANKLTPELAKEIIEVILPKTLMNTAQRNNVSNILFDIIRINQGVKIYNEKLEQYLADPQLLRTDLAKAHVEEEKKLEDENAQSFKESLVNAANLNDFRVAMDTEVEGVDKEKVIDELINEGNENAKNYKETTKYSSEIYNAIKSLNVSPEVKDAAMRLFNNHRTNSSNLNELANPNSVYIDDINSIYNKELSQEDNEKLFASAKFVLAQVMDKVAKDNNFKGRFSRDTPTVHNTQNPDYRDNLEKEGILNKNVAIEGNIVNASATADNKNTALTDEQADMIRGSVEKVLRKKGTDKELQDAIVNTSTNAAISMEALEALKKAFNAYKQDKLSREDVMDLLEEALNIDPFSKKYSQRNVPGVDDTTTGSSEVTATPAVNDNLSDAQTQTQDQSQAQSQAQSQPQSQPLPESPIGDISSTDLAQENKEFNGASNELENDKDSKKATKYYYMPAIPEIDIEGSKEGDFRPFNAVARDDAKSINFDDIYNYLASNGAFTYVNEGNLKEGDEIGFMIDPSFNDHTIFLVDTKNNRIVGSLHESDYKVVQFEGLKNLEEKVRQEFNRRSSADNSRFYASPKTKVSKIMVGKIPYTADEKNLAKVPGVMDNGKSPIFGIVKNGVMFTNGALTDDQITKPVDMRNKEGRLYLLIPNAAGKYSPAAVRVKHFNRNEFNPADVEIQGTPIYKLIKDAIETFANAKDEYAVNDAVKELKKYLYLGNMHIDWVSSNKGNGVRFTLVQRDAQGNEIYEEKDGKRIRKETSKVVFFTDKWDSNVEYTLGRGGVKTSPEDRNTEDIIKEIEKVLLDFNLPIQVNSGMINSTTSAYNRMLLNSGVLTSNISKAEVISSWFTTDYFDDGGNLKQSSPPASIGKGYDNSQTSKSPVGGNESAIAGTPITSVYGNTYYVDIRNKVIRDSKGNIVPNTNNNEILYWLAWAQEKYGDATSSDRMVDNKLVITGGHVLDRTAQKFYHSNSKEAKKVKDALALRPTQSNPITDKVLADLSEDQKRVDKERTTSEHYYVLEDDGQYHEYQRVHSRLGSNYTLSEKNEEYIKKVRSNLAKYVDNVENYNKYLASLSNYLRIDLSAFNNNTDVNSREAIIKIITEKLLKSPGSERALKAGTAVDNIVREFFMFNETPSRPSNITESAYNELLAKLRELKDSMEAAGERFLTNNIVLFHKYADGTRIAGEVDILSIDSNGNFKIYDVKTSKESTIPGSGLNLFNFTIDGKKVTREEVQKFVDSFKKPFPVSRMSSLDYYTLQLSMYKSLFESHYHAPVKDLAILPFRLNYSGEDVTSIIKEPGIRVQYNPNVNLPSTTTVQPNTKPVESKKSDNKVDNKKDNSVKQDPSKPSAQPTQPTKPTQTIDTTLPVFNSIVETLNPINKALEDTELPNSRIGYYVLDGKIYKGHLLPTAIHHGVKISVVKIPVEKSWTEWGSAPPHYTKFDYAVVFPNGYTHVVYENVVAKSVDYGKDIKPGIIEAIEEMSAEKATEIAERKTLISDPGPKPGPSGSSSTASSDSTARTAQNKLRRGKGDGIKLRKKDADRQVWDKEKELAWLQKVLPQLSKQDRVKVVKGLIKIGRKGDVAWGMFNKGIITLSDIAATGTTYHEAFHVVFNALLSNKEKAALLQEARQMYGDLSEIELEEEMAEGFRRYVTSRETKGLLNKIKNFFHDLWIKVTNWRRLQPHLLAYYQMINEGYYAGHDLNASEEERYSEEEYTQEMKDIIAKAKADGTFMKAPNGKPTNLTVRQWVHVRTKAFKKWFGDWENDPENASKVVDKNGEPLVVYKGHKNQDRLTTLSNVLKTGIYFSDNKKVADTYAHSYTDSYFLNIRNPKVYDAEHTTFRSIADVDINIDEAYDKLDDIEKEAYKETLPFYAVTNIDKNTKITKVSKLETIYNLQKVSVCFKKYGIYNQIETKFGKDVLIDILDCLARYISQGDPSIIQNTLDDILSSEEIDTSAVDEAYSKDYLKEQLGISKVQFLHNQITTSKPEILPMSFINTLSAGRAITDNRGNNDGYMVKDVYDAGYLNLEELSHEDLYGNDYVALDGNQIKSATDNIGTYSSENDDIRYRRVDDDNVNNSFDKELGEKLEKLFKNLYPEVELNYTASPISEDIKFGIEEYKVNHPDIVNTVQSRKSLVEELGNIDIKGKVPLQYQISKKRKVQFEKYLEEWQNLLDINDWQVQQFFKYVNTFDDIDQQEILFRWFVDGAINIKEDNYKIERAFELAKEHNLRLYSYKTPMEIINDFGNIKEIEIDKDVFEKYDKIQGLRNRRIEKSTIIYDVDDSTETARIISETIIAKHFETSPWCIFQFDNHGKWVGEHYWKNYSAQPRKIAFDERGEPVRMFASAGEPLWWDVNDQSSRYIPNSYTDEYGITWLGNRGHRGDAKNGEYREYVKDSENNIRLIRVQRKSAHKLHGIQEISRYDDGRLDTKKYYYLGKELHKHSFYDITIDGTEEGPIRVDFGNSKLRKYSEQLYFDFTNIEAKPIISFYNMHYSFDEYFLFIHRIQENKNEINKIRERTYYLSVFFEDHKDLASIFEDKQELLNIVKIPLLNKYDTAEQLLSNTRFKNERQAYGFIKHLLYSKLNNNFENVNKNYLRTIRDHKKNVQKLNYLLYYNSHPDANTYRPTEEGLPFQIENEIINGVYDPKALSILIDVINQKQDTLPHEYAHHYINIFRNSSLVQEALKRFGNEESLVQALGEQVVKRKGEAFTWWEKFISWIKGLFNRNQYLVERLSDALVRRELLNIKNNIELNLNNINNSQDSLKDAVNEYRSKEKENASFKSISNENREILTQKGWTQERFDSISQREKDQLIKCIAF